MSGNYQLDWLNQPNPFRNYDGAHSISLPSPNFVSALSYFEAVEFLLAGQGLARIDTEVKHPVVLPANLEFLSQLLYYSMGISAWKQLGKSEHRWSLRVNPSSGDLHPTETHLLVQGLSGLEPGAYHYDVRRHSLEQRQRGQVAPSIWHNLTGSIDSPPVVVCLTSIFWREAWKYRDRAFRYCHHDLGHAMAAIMLSAAALGWRGEAIAEFPDTELAVSLGLDGHDESPGLVIGLYPGLQLISAAKSPDVLPNWEDSNEPFFGIPNLLSANSLKYQSIEQVYESTCLSVDRWLDRLKRGARSRCRRISTVSARGAEQPVTYSLESSGRESVHRIVRKRRSAVDMDGRQEMQFDQLGNILVSSTRGFKADFQGTTAWMPSVNVVDSGHHFIHLYLYAHRISGLNSGLYYFDRLAQILVPVLLADQKESVKFFSCFQDIAADGCFAISMIADLNLAYELYGDRCYRYVHYEAGWIGQFLYLSACALGYDATGIGCFIDDLINQHLDLPAGFEVIYNFTVGKAVSDPRLTTLPSYDFKDPALDAKGD